MGFSKKSNAATILIFEFIQFFKSFSFYEINAVKEISK